MYCVSASICPLNLDGFHMRLEVLRIPGDVRKILERAVIEAAAPWRRRNANAGAHR